MRVTAAIFRKDDCVLMMRRGENQPLAGQWEYPGGKFEENEDGPQCLRRELREELGINATIGDLITIAMHTTDGGKTIELYAYEVTNYDGEISLSVHDSMEWVALRELMRHPQLPADLLVSSVLTRQYHHD